MWPPPRRLAIALAALAVLVACQPHAPREPAGAATSRAPMAAPPEAPLPVLDEREDADVAALRGTAERMPAYERLAKRMALAEPAADAAALQLARLLEDDDLDLRRAARALVRIRLEAKIAGEYLGRLSATLRADFAPPEEGTPDRQPGKAVYDTLAYLQLVPTDEATRNELTIWARAHARLGKSSDGVRAPYTAWHALLALGVLRDGMTLAEAVGVLGLPTSKTHAVVDWYAASSMHVNPGLSAELRGDVLVVFHLMMR